MKRLLYILIMCSFFCSCDKMPANGDLDGMWQIVEIEHDGQTRNVQAEQVYMSIQLRLFQLTDYPGNTVYGYFEHKGDEIRFWKFSYPSQQESAEDNNLPYTEQDVKKLNKWGYYSLNETFHVEELTRNILVMKSDSARIKYIKF